MSLPGISQTPPFSLLVLSNIALNSSWDIKAPVGLFGVHKNRNLVFSLKLK